MPTNAHKNKRKGFIIPLIAVFLALMTVAAAVLLPIMAISSRFRHQGDPLNQVFGGGGMQNVPENYTEIFTQAGNKFSVQPAFIAAIFLAGEHHAYSRDFDPSTPWPNPGGPWGNADGPFQFLPGTWSGKNGIGHLTNPSEIAQNGGMGQDGNGDGIADVNNLWDSAFAAAYYLGREGAGGNTTDENKLFKAAAIYNDGSLTPKGEFYATRVMQAFRYFFAPTPSGQCGQAILAQAAIYEGIDYNQAATKTHDHCGPIPRTIGRNNVRYLDCSGFVSRVYWDLGLFPLGACEYTGSIPGNPNLQEINAEEIQPGDLVLSGIPAGGDGLGHVVIYVSGNVKINFMAWESGGQGSGSVALESRIAHLPQKYFRAKKCADVAQPLPPVGNQIIVIDPGHGTADNNRENENYVNMQVALALEAKLKEKGLRTVLTHTSGQDITPGQDGERNDNIARANIANQAGASLMIRIHGDAGNSKKFFMVYPDRSGGKEGPPGPPANVITSSRTAAKNIHNSLTLVGLQPQYGAPRSDYEATAEAKNNGGVLVGSQYSRVPVVLIEMAGVETQEGRQWVLNNKEKYAQGMTDGILRFLGSK